MTLKKISRIFSLFLIVFLFGSLAGAQEHTEMLRIGIAQISNPIFVPATDGEVVFSGEILYLTKEGEFGEPEINAKITGQNLERELDIDLKPLSLDSLPEEHKGKAKHWSFKVAWDGMGSDSFPAEAGRYTCQITAKVLKAITVVETDAQGNEKEVKKEIETEQAASAPVLLKIE